MAIQIAVWPPRGICPESKNKNKKQYKKLGYLECVFIQNPFLWGPQENEGTIKRKEKRRGEGEWEEDKREKKRKRRRDF